MATMNELMKALKYLKQLHLLLQILERTVILEHAPAGSEAPFSGIRFKYRGDIYEVRGVIKKIADTNEPE